MSIEQLSRRARTWDEIFTGPDDAQQQYADFIQSCLEEYSQHVDFAGQSEYRDSLTETAVTVFPDTSGGFASVQKLPNGNVRLVFKRKEEHVSEITPEVGLLDPKWNYQTVKDLKSKLQKLLDSTNTGSSKIHRVAVVYGYIHGKPATRGWERIFLEEHDRPHFPVRIGYRIYSRHMLEEALALTY